MEDKQTTKFKEFPEKKIPFKVTFQSCVGISGKDYPLDFGNYCGIGDYNHNLFNDSYCCNMWAENIKEFKRLDPKIKNVKVKMFGSVVVIIDIRIPIEWRSSFCITGYGGMPIKFLKPLLEYCKQPLDEYICGCETEDMLPKIYTSYDYETKIKESCCKHCETKTVINV